MGRCYQPDLLIDLMAAIGTAVFLVGHFDFGLFFRPTVAFTRPAGRRRSPKALRQTVEQMRIVINGLLLKNFSHTPSSKPLPRSLESCSMPASRGLPASA
jgi:hypothetical protein